MKSLHFLKWNIVADNFDKRLNSRLTESLIKIKRVDEHFIWFIVRPDCIGFTLMIRDLAILSSKS